MPNPRKMSVSIVILFGRRFILGNKENKRRYFRVNNFFGPPPFFFHPFSVAKLFVLSEAKLIRRLGARLIKLPADRRQS
jgi:hypothetical protein